MKELEEYGRKGELSTGSLEVIDKLAHTVKNLCKIIEDSEGGDYSMEGRSYRDGGNMGGNSYRQGRSYRGGNSYARGRGRNARRDSMGRYSREYSGDAEEMISQLENLMDDAPEPIKKDIEKLIAKAENM